jgi:hypothetical protein
MTPITLIYDVINIFIIGLSVKRIVLYLPWKINVLILYIFFWAKIPFPKIALCTYACERYSCKKIRNQTLAFVKPAFRLQTSSPANLVLLMSCLSTANLEFKSKMQFSSWASVMDYCADGCTIKSQLNQMSNMCNYIAKSVIFYFCLYTIFAIAFVDTLMICLHTKFQISLAQMPNRN